MKMSDKELDQLFQSRLQSLEEMPSAGLWGNIEKKLDARPKYIYLKRALALAASVLIIAVLWVNIGNEAYVVSHAEEPPVSEEKVAAEPAEVLASRAPAQHALAAANSGQKVENAKRKKEKPLFAKQLAEDVPHIVNDKLQETVEIEDAPMMATIIPEQPLPMVVEEISGNILVEEDREDDYVQDKKQSRVKSLGGLINRVIAQVDKREDKLLAFDEVGEESNLVSMNLGIVKFKRNK
jgi:hypothetical protein